MLGRAINVSLHPGTAAYNYSLGYSQNGEHLHSISVIIFLEGHNRQHSGQMSQNIKN